MRQSWIVPSVFFTLVDPWKGFYMMDDMGNAFRVELRIILTEGEACT